jgi:hypothetical protein
MDRKASIVWCTMSVLDNDWHPCRLKPHENAEIELMADTREPISEYVHQLTTSGLRHISINPSRTACMHLKFEIWLGTTVRFRVAIAAANQLTSRSID